MNRRPIFTNVSSGSSPPARPLADDEHVIDWGTLLRKSLSALAIAVVAYLLSRRAERKRHERRASTGG